MKKLVVGEPEATLTECKMLLHGDYCSGKSHLMGTALKAQLAHGPGLLIITQGEPSLSTIQGLGMPDLEVVVIEHYTDIDEVVKEYGGKGLQVVGFDSLALLSDLVIEKVTGGLRGPGQADRNGKTHDGRAEWGAVKNDFRRAVKQVQRLAPFFYAVCPSSKNENELTGQMSITPDLPGKQAVGIVGMFSYVGYVDYTPLSPTKVQRRVHFEPLGSIATRCNLPRPIVKPILLPEGGGGWAAVEAEIMACLKGGKQ